jgi:hypothetical protein
MLEYYKTISSIFFLLWKDKYIPDQEMKAIIYTSHHDFISSFIRILLEDPDLLLKQFYLKYLKYQ